MFIISLIIFHQYLFKVGTKWGKSNLIMLKDAVSEMPFAEPLILRFWELQISLLRHNYRSYLLYAITEVVAVKEQVDL